MNAEKKHPMSDADIERLTANSVMDLFRKGKLYRGDVDHWIRHVKENSRRLYEPVYSSRRIDGKIHEDLLLKLQKQYSMSDADIERLTANSLMDLFRKGRLYRSDVEHWIRHVKENSGRIYEPVYSSRRTGGKTHEDLLLKRREDIEAEDYSPGHSRKKSSFQLQREIDEALARQRRITKPRAPKAHARR